MHRAEGTVDADGTLIRVVGTCADVTERQRAEQALRDGEARLETALRMGQVFAFDWDVTTNAVRRSENAAEILGVTAAEVQMSRQVFAGYVHPEDCERMARDVAEMVPTAPVNNTRFRFLRPDKRVAWLEISQGGTFDASGRLIRVTGLTRDVTERQIAEERQVRLIEELNHRVKNTLARVSVVIERSRDGQSSIDDYVAALDGRIKSMARTQERLSDSKWDGVDIATLVDDELTPFRTQFNTSVEGPDIVLAADAAQAVSLTLHELATNAAKHGALGSGGGHVTVRWRLEDLPSREPASKPEQVMRLEWSEATGREMSTTPKEGFGVSTIRGLTSFELEADVALEFSATGVCCTLVIPAERLFHRAPDPTRAGPLAINPSASAAEVR